MSLRASHARKNGDLEPAWSLAHHRNVRTSSIASLIGLAVLASACGGADRSSEGSEVSSGGSASCAWVAFLDGHEYLGGNAVVHPVPGETVGEIRIPGCNDTGQSEAPPDEWRTVAVLPGVDASVAVVDAEMPEVIYVRADLDSYPSGIDRYFDAPECVSADEPIDLEGPWLSIPGTDANKEPDPVPPYRVEVLVVKSSASRYANAELTIAVPPTLGMPITHADVEESLWGGGSLRVTAACDGERFIAESIEVIRPVAS
jgi:hypothetical protein